MENIQLLINHIIQNNFKYNNYQSYSIILTIKVKELTTKEKQAKAIYILHHDTCSIMSPKYFFTT